MLFNKPHIDKKPKLLDEAIHRFSVSFAADLPSVCRLTQTNMQIGVLREQLRMAGALVEFDRISRERHDRSPSFAAKHRPQSPWPGTPAASNPFCSI
ncbi:hypothetical protein L208DRAFT_1397881 [Tricholoma matsutake]|nr:hypothetical protein L208DRAFT_1397881 [Tricholoma matsutake 945]